MRKKHLIDEKLTEKACKTCNKILKVSSFYISYRHLDGYFSECISCTEVKRNNKGNNQRIKRTPEYMVQYIKKRKEDPQYRMRYALRSNLQSAIKRINFSVKSERTMKYLDCSLDFIKLWFEFLFDTNMNWDNYGSYWHIDHIKPCASFDLTKQESIYECYNWTNLRPLEKNENIKKGDLINEQLIQEYKDLKDAFLGLYTTYTTAS